MLWQSIDTYPCHLQPVRWRCPDCGGRCIAIGTPQISIQSQHVNGGEYLTFECTGSHLIQPQPKHFISNG